MNSDSGFMQEEEMLDRASVYHDLQQAAETSHALLTTALRDGRRWMLKSLPAAHRHSPFHLALQQKEYDILCRLSHPYIVSVRELTNVPSLGPSVVMEYVDGDTLDKATLRQPQRRRVARQLAEAVAYMHSRQVVHRDLKPTNIMLTHNGLNVKLVDFGLADTDAHTILKQPAGTRGYMSPEQAESDVPDVRNDIYSLGLIFKELNLGWPYRRLIRRMLRPMDRRTASMAEVLQQMDQAERAASRLLTAFLLLFCVGMAVGLLLLWSRREVPSSTGAPAPSAAPADTLQRTATTADSLLATPQEPSAPTPQKEATSAPPAPAPEESTLPTYDEACQQGIALIDDYMQRHHFSEVVDTITTLHSLNRVVGHMMGEATSLADDFARRSTADEPSRQAMKHQLDNHLVATYWIPYFVQLNH